MSQEPAPEDFPSSGYAWYVVGVLTLAYIFSFIDRQIISMLIGPIKRDLQLDDTQISLLGSFSFAVFYTLFGIPLGRLADTRSRRAIISWGITFWSLMTAACGLTKNFWQLATMRMGVGIGEATLSPAAYSLIADYFPPQRRATAMSVYSMGIYIGSGLAFILGGLVAQLAASQEQYSLPFVGSVRSWQFVFFVVGLPGLLVALLMVTVREPKRQGPGRGGKAASLQELGQYVRANFSTFATLTLGIAFVTLNSYASIFWMIELFLRKFEWTRAQAGLMYGTVVALSGTLGVVSGGWVADRWTRLGMVDAPVRVAWLSCIGWLPFGILYPLAPNGLLTAALLIPVVFFGSMPFGVAPAAIQRMMPNSMRAQATAIYLFVINIIGMGLGPTVAALCTDHVFRQERMLHYSLLVVGVSAYALAVVLLGLSLSCYRRSLDYLQSWAPPQANS